MPYNTMDITNIIKTVRYYAFSIEFNIKNVRLHPFAFKLKYAIHDNTTRQYLDTLLFYFYISMGVNIMIMIMMWYCPIACLPPLASKLAPKSRV